MTRLQHTCLRRFFVSTLKQKDISQRIIIALLFQRKFSFSHATYVPKILLLATFSADMTVLPDYENKIKANMTDY